MMTMDIELRPTPHGWTDGTFRYWRARRQYRWALIDWPEGGPSFRTHGARATLEEAVQDAWEEHHQRLACEQWEREHDGT